MTDLNELLRLAGLPHDRKTIKEAEQFNFLRELMEAADRYGAMFNVFPEESRKEVAHEISWAKTYLKREDRIVWYLRWLRINLLSNAIKTTQNPELNEKFKKALSKAAGEMSNKAGLNAAVVPGLASTVSRGHWRGEITHLLSMEDTILPIRNYQFAFQSPETVIEDLNKIETENTKDIGRAVPATDADEDGVAEKIIDFGDGYAWWNLNVTSCSVEAKAMGHCGNSAAEKDGDQVLSLRKREKRGSSFVDVPCLTFILDEKGRLGEMKGRGNQKPAEHYHKYIIPLLLSDIVESIKGGGYLRQNNFSLNDLPEEQKAELLEKKPSLSGEMTFDSVLELFDEQGIGYERIDGENLKVWEGRFDDLPDNDYLTSLRNVVAMSEATSGDDLSIINIVQDLDHQSLIKLAAFVDYKPDARGGYTFAQLANYIEGSEKAMNFIKNAIKATGSGFDLEQVSDLFKKYTYFFVETRYSDICQPSLEVPDDPFDGKFSVTISFSEAESIAENIEQDGDEYWSFKSSWFDDDDQIEQSFRERLRDDRGTFTRIEKRIFKAIVDGTKDNAQPIIDGDRDIADIIADALSKDHHLRHDRPGKEEMDDLFGG